MPLKQNFKISVLRHVAGEECVRALLSGAEDTDYAYTEAELLDISKDEGNPLADAAFYARLAVIREKSDLGFLNPANKPNKFSKPLADFQSVTIAEVTPEYFERYLEQRAQAAREDVYFKGQEEERSRFLSGDYDV